MKKTKIKLKSNSLTDTAHFMLLNSDETYKSIAARTDFKFSWLLNFNKKYNLGHKFFACDLERLISELGGEIVVNIPIFRKDIFKKRVGEIGFLKESK